MQIETMMIRFQVGTCDFTTKTSTIAQYQRCHCGHYRNPATASSTKLQASNQRFAFWCCSVIIKSWLPVEFETNHVLVRPVCGGFAFGVCLAPLFKNFWVCKLAGRHANIDYRTQETVLRRRGHHCGRCVAMHSATVPENQIACMHANQSMGCSPQWTLLPDLDVIHVRRGHL